MSGRSRRARGRARGRGSSGDSATPVSRPGDVAAAMQTPSEVQGAQAAHSGRASHRGGAMVDQRPGDAPPTAAMEGLSIGGDQQRERRYAAARYIEPRTRPVHMLNKVGEFGTQVELVGNYFKVESQRDRHFYQYHVSFAPDVESKWTRMGLIKEQASHFGPVRVYDGGDCLVLSKKMDNQVTELTGIIKRDGTIITITIKLTNELPPSHPTCIHVNNIIFNRVLNMIGMKQVGRHYFSQEEAEHIPQHKLEVWPGFITSILQYETSILLCAEISHKIMRSDTVLDILYELYGQRRQGFHDAAVRKLVGEIVLTRYNNKTYRVDDINWELNPTSEFETKDGTKISFVQYYQETHNLTISDLQQPLLVSRPKKKDLRRGVQGDILLVPELSTLTGLSDEVRADFNVMRDVAAKTRLDPQARNTKLQQFIQRITSNEQVGKELAGWGLQFSENLVKINARVLPTEKIIQWNKTFSYKAEDADWSREMRGAQLITCVPLRNWIMVYTDRDEQKAMDFLQNFKRVGPPMGIQVNDPTRIPLPDDNNNTFLSAIKRALNDQTQLVFCVLPTNKKDRYDAIKKFCCINMPVPSQMVLGKTLGKLKMLMSVATKIAIQVNCKLGGEVWALDIPLKGMMVIGIDTYHDSKQKGRSVGAFVASMNRNLTRYYSRCCFQHQSQELLDGLRVCAQGALKEYHRVNGSFPERIFIYRDGVGDGQLGQVVDYEVPQLLKCFCSQYPEGGNPPKISVIVVKKRINSRFFATGSRGLTNPTPGTVVDTEVTKPEWFDFFLVSQSVRQGTVSPTHYNVVWDTNSLGPDKMQRLTYKMTHLYYNWPGTIRVPAPCQYAHKMAFLVGQSLHEEPAMELADRLYYL